IPIKGIEVRLEKNTLIISSDRELKTLSSAVIGGGLTHTNYIICDKNPEKTLLDITREYSIVNPVGIFPAGNIENLALNCEKSKSATVVAIVSCGTINKNLSESGTINLILLIDSDLTDSALCNAIITATEAKTLALQELDIRSSTDSIVVACTGEGKTIKHSGSAEEKEVVYMIRRTVKHSVKEVILPRLGSIAAISIFERLKERGITIEDLIDAESELYIPNPKLNKADFLEIFRKELLKTVQDINVSSLILAGLRLEEDGNKGLIPNLTATEFQSDPIHLVADEILGMEIANYIAGTNGVFEFRRVDRIKPKIIGKVGPFMDDLLAGLIAGVSSKIFSRINESDIEWN
ncbi:MAG: phosphatidylglycerophosphatase A, partial [Methanosarcinales archaeon]